MKDQTSATTRRFAIILFAAAATACGNLTVGGVGEVTVTLSGDDPESAHLSAVGMRDQERGTRWAADLPTAWTARSRAESDHDDDDPEGELEVEFELFLEAENGDLVTLTPMGEIRVQVDLEGVENPEIANQTVDARRYTGLRIVFEEIEAEVDAGLIINGVPFTGSVRVEIDNPLPVSRALDLDIQPDAAVSVRIDLNATEWLQALDPTSGTIDPQVFADLIVITIG